jgi:ribonuclease P protein subunit RPR2
MKRRYKTKPAVFTKIALTRIKKLFEEAAKAKEQRLANRYVELARRIGMRYKTRIPSELKRRYCKHCYSYLVPSKNCRVRLAGKKVVYCCFNCKKFMRFPYSKKK